MLTLTQVTKSFGGRTLFSEGSLQINRNDRIGLVGPNGAGKSTLFSLILGEYTPDEGSIAFESNVAVGFLPQETVPTTDDTVLELAVNITPEIAKLRRVLEHHDAPEDADAFHRAQHRFEELNGYALEPAAKRILGGLAFRQDDFDKPVKELSGGWIMRAYLARLLVQEPDLLMLDEPTNHLDLESLIWLQNYLKAYPGTILMVSHDREFLNEIVDSIIDIDGTRLYRYRGSYDHYLMQRQARQEQHLAAYKNQQREIQALEQFIVRFRAKNTKASQAKSKQKQIDRMVKIEPPASAAATIRFRFPQPERSGRKALSVENIHHAYGENVVYRGVDFALERGDRVVFVGPNGAGKSTLLKLLAGVVPVQRGLREVGYRVNIAYYSQNRIDMLNPERTVLEEVLDGPRPLPNETARTVLGSFLFRGDDVFKSVNVLSGGEKSRLALVKLLLDPPNVLLMDEPTTHLDMASIDALIGALEPYQGTLAFISHDVHFIRSQATSVLHVNNGRLTPYPGDYDYYVAQTRQAAAGTAGGGGDAPAPSRGPDAKPAAVADAPRYKTKDQKRREAEERQARSRAQREQKRRLAKLEEEIEEMEARQKELTEVLEDPASYDDTATVVETNREMLAVTERIERLTTEWERAAAEAERAAAGSQ